MSNKLYESLNSKTTDELKYIFRNDQDIYRLEAITIIKKILVERDEDITQVERDEDITQVERGEDITQVEQNEETQRQKIIEQRLQEKMNRHKLGKTQTPFQSFLKGLLQVLWIIVLPMLIFSRGVLNIYSITGLLVMIFFPLHLIYFLVSLVNKKKKPKEEVDLSAKEEVDLGAKYTKEPKSADIPLISFLFVTGFLIINILIIYNS